jgi:hypothetical protein
MFGFRQLINECSNGIDTFHVMSIPGECRRFERSVQKAEFASLRVERFVINEIKFADLESRNVLSYRNRRTLLQRSRSLAATRLSAI